MPNQLKKQLNRKILDRQKYLIQIEDQISEVVEAGQDKIKELQFDIDTLEKEKARLTKQLLSIQQDIELAKQSK